MATYDFDILFLNDQGAWVSIKEKVIDCDLRFSKTSYCNEIILTLADREIYEGIDFDVIPAEERLEVTIEGVSQGRFFIEQPDVLADIDQVTIPSLWGRSTTARLSEPFARRVTKTWDEDTTMFAVVQELVSIAGLNPATVQIDIDDFPIFANTLVADNEYPQSVLARLVLATNGYIRCKKNGSVWIKKHLFHHTSADRTVTDDVIMAGFRERPIFPTFGNRIKLSTETAQGLRIDLYASDVCLPPDGGTTVTIYAMITNPDGSAVVDGTAVQWSTENDLVTLDHAVSNVATATINNEETRAESFTQITTQLPISELIGVWGAADTARTTNFGEGATVAGQRITLANELLYCDQSVVVAYRTEGVAINKVTTGLESGNVFVYASIGGMREGLEFFIDNPCRCPMALFVRPNPTSILQQESSLVLVVGEEAGGPATIGRRVYTSEPSRLGTLAWTSGRFGTVSYAGERARAINDVLGITEIQTEFFPDSVTGVYADEGRSTNLYQTHTGKRVILNTNIGTDTELIVDYVVTGAAVVTFTAGDTSVGTARVRGTTPSRIEAGVSAEGTIQIRDPDSAEEDYPDDWNDPDGGGDQDTPDVDVDAVTCKGVTCQPGESCCARTPTGQSECTPSADCASTIYGCGPPDMSESTDEVGSDAWNEERFSDPPAGREDEGGSCSCEDMCAAEFEAFGTYQGFDGGSMKSIEFLAAQQCFALGGCAPGQEEAIAAGLKEQGLGECLDQCQGPCDTEFSVSGPGTATYASGRWKGTIEPPCPGLECEVEIDTGAGAADFSCGVSGDGSQITVRFSGNACGNFRVRVFKGLSEAYGPQVRITDAGQWYLTGGGSAIFCNGPWCGVTFEGEGSEGGHSWRIWGGSGIFCGYAQTLGCRWDPPGSGPVHFTKSVNAGMIQATCPYSLFGASISHFGCPGL